MRFSGQSATNDVHAFAIGAMVLIFADVARRGATVAFHCVQPLSILVARRDPGPVALPELS